MKQDADVFCVKYGEKCGLCSLQVRFKFAVVFICRQQRKKQTKKKGFTSSVYFQFAHRNWVNPAMFTCNINREVHYWIRMFIYVSIEPL